MEEEDALERAHKFFDNGEEEIEASEEKEAISRCCSEWYINVF